MDDDGSTVPVMLTAGTLPKVSINRAAKARTCVRMDQCMHACMHACMQMHACMHGYRDMHRVYACTATSIRACACACLYTYAHVHTCIYVT